MSYVLSPATSPEDGEDSAPKRLNRSSVACGRCHDHKIKCSGERPKCRNCQQAKKPRDCVYPVRDRKLSIPESYLRRLEEENRELKRKRSSQSVSLAGPTATPRSSHHALFPFSTASASVTGITNSEAQVDEDFGFENDETFIEPNYVGEAACTTFGNRLHQYLTGEDSQWPHRRPHYYRNHRLHRLMNPEYHLPERDDAQVLVMAVLNFIGPDYHLLLRNSFLDRLDKTYQAGRCDDHVWLCRLFVVFALGELYSQGASDTQGGRLVPGTSYFMKAMDLFEDLYEEPSIDYIETLLVIAFYSTALNRIIPAYTYSGLALRLSLALGLHRKIPQSRILSSREREHRIRVWWTVYNLDRVCSSKVGLPIMLRDEDVDVPLPSMDSLTEEEKEDFHDPCHIIAQHKLAKITGEILNEIYRIPQPGRAKTFPLRVHKVLTSLQSWQDDLPPILRFNQRTCPMYSSRSVASLHLNYSQCVILATRPIFFPCLRAHHEASKTEHSHGPRPLSDLVEGLSEACVTAARTSSSIIAQLRASRDLATFGFFDALSIFSSTLILMMSSTMQFKSREGDRGKVETSLKLLKNMRDDGNIPAHNYYDQLMQLKNALDHAVDYMETSLATTQVHGTPSHGPQTFQASGGSHTSNEDGGGGGPRHMNGGHSFAAFGNPYDTRAVLNDPFIQDFLNSQQPDAQCLVDSGPFFTDDGTGYFDFDILDVNGSGMFESFYPPVGRFPP